MKTLYKNARVYTGALPLAESFVVEDGVFRFVGSSAELAGHTASLSGLPDALRAFAADPETIHQIPVLATYLSGRPVYRKEDAI